MRRLEEEHKKFEKKMKYDKKHYSQFGSIAKGLAKACEFGESYNRNVY